MPPLLIPSPTFLDQSFPRSKDELQRVAIALSAIIESTDNSNCGILTTQALCDFVELFDWERGSSHPLLLDIYRLITQLLLQPHDLLFEIPTDGIDAPPHPAPQSCTQLGLIDEWSSEVGKILHLHATYGDSSNPHIGIACALAFSDEEKDQYSTHQGTLPLVGPDDLERLEDAYEWNISSDIHKKKISFALAKKHCFAIGATEVCAPANSSHYIVKFERKRPWVLDCNTDPIPDRFLGQLKLITGYPIMAIKHALLTGEMPNRRPRIPQLRRINGQE